MANYKILFLDDDHYVSMAAELFLRSVASQITFTTTAKEFFDKFSSDEIYDLLIIDYMLPDMDGMKILKEIRNREKGKTIPVIIQTGILNLKIDQVEKLDAKILFKPYTKNDLCEQISLCFANK